MHNFGEVFIVLLGDELAESIDSFHVSRRFVSENDLRWLLFLLFVFIVAFFTLWLGWSFLIVKLYNFRPATRNL